MAAIKQEEEYEPGYEPPPETAVLDNYLAVEDFAKRLCLVKTEGEGGKLWPALRFENMGELQDAMKRDVKVPEAALALLRHKVLKAGGLGVGGFAYLLGRGKVKRSLVAVSNEVEDFYSVISTLQNEDEYKDDEEFKAALTLALDLDQRVKYAPGDEPSPVKQEGAKSEETPAAGAAELTKGQEADASSPANTNGTKDEEANSNNAAAAAAADDDEDDNGTVTVPLQINAATLDENEESEETPAANPAELTNGREADASPPATAEAQSREAVETQARGAAAREAAEAQAREVAAAVEFGEGGEEEETAKGGGGGIPNDALLTNRQAESQPNVVGAPTNDVSANAKDEEAGEASNNGAANDDEDYDDGVATLPLRKDSPTVPLSVNIVGQRVVDSPLTTVSGRQAEAAKQTTKRKGEPKGNGGKKQKTAPKKGKKAKSNRVSLSPAKPLKKVATDEDISKMISPIDERYRVMTNDDALKLLQSKFGVIMSDGRYCIPSQGNPVFTSLHDLQKDLCINGLPSSGTSELTEEQRVDIARWVRYANIPGLVDGQTITPADPINKFMDAWGILTHKFGCQYSSGIYTVPMSRSGGDKKRFEETQEVERHFARYGIPCIPADVSEDVLSQKDRLSLEIFFATPPFKVLNTFERESPGGSRRRKRVNYREN